MTDIKPDLVVTDLPDPAPSSPLEALEWLGSTVEEVVEGLRARGIKGTHDPRSCPIHNYLGEWGWNVGATGSLLFLGPQHQCVTTLTPWPIKYFIQSFDAGEFPDLVAD